MKIVRVLEDDRIFVRTLFVREVCLMENRDPLQREEGRRNAREMINWSGKNLFTFDDRLLKYRTGKSKVLLSFFILPLQEFLCDARKDNN